MGRTSTLSGPGSVEEAALWMGTPSLTGSTPPLVSHTRRETPSCTQAFVIPPRLSGIDDISQVLLACWNKVLCPLRPTALAASVQAMSLSISPAQTAAWRKQIFEQLSERSKREMDNFQHYEQAIEQVAETPDSSQPTQQAIPWLANRKLKCLHVFCSFGWLSSDLSLFVFVPPPHNPPVCVGEEGHHAVVAGLEALQVGGRQVRPGAVLRARG